ncbi:GFA family protein [Phreatobacter stygius]|uniref:GFA family protein n=2 Tax=Phreatobacter stygius TaxID=1940610 RepID=A0A4D7BCI6_9HYPH|nr:GFA family protein [Phreatobacter stygius]QCI67738.1 GFA family protein [Phreatobacter stygius]
MTQTPKQVLSGSCLCGSLAYEVDGSAGPIVHCHCVTCRKAHGSAFSSVSNVPRASFRWTRGQHDVLRGYESSPGKTRHFCAKCGSHIMAERVGAATVLLRLGCLDTPIAETPVAHIWRSDAASWYDPKVSVPEHQDGFPR